MKLRHQLAVFGFFFFVYMLGASREIPWNDAKYMFNTAESIVFRGTLGIPTGVPGVVTYGPHPLLPSLALVPGVMIYQWIVARWLPAWSMAKVITCHLGSAFFGALTCVLFLNACLRLGVSKRTASFMTLLLGFATMTSVYARSPYSEIVQAASVIGYFGALLSFWERQDYKTAIRVGLWGALMLNSKLILALALPGGLAICVYRMRRQLKEFLGLSICALVPIALGGFVILKHNEVRSGVAMATGYAVTPQIFAQPLWEGLWGLVGSPGRSIFLFAPPLLLSLFALRETKRRKPQLLWMLGLCLPPIVYLYAKFEAWSGDWSWGPRYLVPMVAPLLLPAAVLVDSLDLQRIKRGWLVLVGTICLSGLFVQVLGHFFYWDHFIRISQEARNSWLGNPNRTGSKGVPRANGCDPCFEDYYPFQWLPPFQQIEGHWWLLKTVPFKKTWDEATLSAPWSRYTKLALPIEHSFRQARVDWWVLQFWKTYKPASFALIVTFSTGIFGCAIAWALSCRKTRPVIKSVANGILEDGGSAPAVSGA